MRRSSTSPTSASSAICKQIVAEARPSSSGLARADVGAEIRAADFPPPFSTATRSSRHADGSARRAHRRRRPDRRWRPRRARRARSASVSCSRSDPATAERLGEVPVAVVEKGKQPGSHLLSGAVMNPARCATLFPGRPDQLAGHPDLRRGAGRGRLPADAKRGRSGSRPRRRCATTGTGSSRSRSCPAVSPSRPRRGGTFVLPETVARPPARRARPRRGHPHAATRVAAGRGSRSATSSPGRTSARR